MKTDLKLFIFFMLALSSCSVEEDYNVYILPTDIPILKVFSCDNDSLPLSDEAKNALMTAGMTQCMMPFGVLLSADQNMPKPYIEMAGKILAEMLDQNLDGIMDDSTLFEYISDWQSCWLAMPTNYNLWETVQLPILYDELGYDIIIPSWWMGTTTLEPNSHSIAVMVEEVTHFLTQFGYSSQYPDEFGVENWSSTIAQEVNMAQCEWWQHPENNCPNSPAQMNGDCSGPNCDVVEFYHQVLVTRAGMEPGWLGIGFPTSSNDLEQLLSPKIKALMDNPDYHQLKTPLTFSYPIVD